MHKIEVTGGSPLSGQVQVSGFKHAFPPLFSLALSSNQPSLIKNVPDIADIRILGKIGQLLGADIVYEPEKRAMYIDPRSLNNSNIPGDLSALIHGAWYLAPGLLARTGHIVLGETGGCKIGGGQEGERPIEQLCSVLQRFGATVKAEGNIIQATAQRFSSARIDMADFAVPEEGTDKLTGPLYSGATKAALLCAARAEGISEIINPYPKPDVVALVEAIKCQQVAIQWEKNRIIIEGKPEAGGFETTIGPDLIEVMTYLTLSTYCHAPISITNVSRKHIETGLSAEIACLEKLGYLLQWQGNNLSIAHVSPASRLEIQVTSHGIFSDNQPFMALLLMASEQGGSLTEQVWVKRFQYIEELEKMGAKIIRSGRTVEIMPGVPGKSGITVNATDLRGAAALVIAALQISGKTQIGGVDHLERGYPDLLGQLRLLGAKV
ncbi:UDP-N-acetylglucosamine 1-carboxyvinyltransferase [Xenorhabdus bovienii]|uniref:UDP-N-acetylglucosamine 1-carboxyvinyltransferase n=1 Tax=Xenorhabdus bovienii TaxID=40576 RepID=UPI003DA50768